MVELAGVEAGFHGPGIQSAAVQVIQCRVAVEQSVTEVGEHAFQESGIHCNGGFFSHRGTHWDGRNCRYFSQQAPGFEDGFVLGGSLLEHDKVDHIHAPSVGLAVGREAVGGAVWG